MFTSLVVLCTALAGALGITALTIHSSDPRIYYHGRWDDSPGTWWAGSGFKLHAENVKSLQLQLGPHTTAPFAAVGVSIDYAPYFTVNVTEGLNTIPLDTSTPSSRRRSQRSVIRINVEGWQNNRMNLEKIILNDGARLRSYRPSRTSFQFIGDSLSAGQFLPLGVNQAWPLLVGEHFKAEHTVTAQPGAALTDIVSYGNVHGVSYQFFQTEDTGFIWAADHNYTTPWDFARDKPPPTHIIIHIGANDASQGVTQDQFIQVYSDFLTRLRTIYVDQPIFVFTPWGWPNSDGNVYYYYDGAYTDIVQRRIALGDNQVFLVNTTGWVTFQDVYPDNVHPDVPGHEKISGLFTAWLENWGLRPNRQWAITPS